MNSKQKKAWRKCRVQQALYRKLDMQNVRAGVFHTLFLRHYKKGALVPMGNAAHYLGAKEARCKANKLREIKKLWRKRIGWMRENTQLEMLELIP